MDKKDETKARSTVLPFEDTAKLEARETKAIDEAATAKGAPPVGEAKEKDAEITVEKNTEGFFVVKGAIGGAYYGDEATARRVAAALAADKTASSDETASSDKPAP